MGIVFKSLYIHIYNLGLLVGNMFGFIGRFFKISFFSNIKRFFSDFADFNRKSFTSAALFFKRAIAFVLIAAIIAASGIFIKSKSNKINAVAIMIADETVGFAETNEEAELARSKALEALGNNADADAVKTDDKKTAACNILSVDLLTEKIVKKLSPELIKVCEIYIDNEFYCAVRNQLSAREALNEILAKGQKQYPNASVSFAQKVAFKYAYRAESDEMLWSKDKLLLTLKAMSPLTIQHIECERNISDVEFDTVEIETNTLFIGDSRVRRVGENGQEYAIDLVTYMGNKKVLSEHLTSLTIKSPVSQVIEKGMRAESLSMGTYTVTQTSGVFCWPVVGLYTVTSPFGYRSLGYHHGLDISGANASGSLVVAGASGVVEEAGWSTGGYGNYVIIDHGNGVETLYGHMLDNSILVSPGETVTKGQAVGRVGNTGYSFGAHLHFEVRINGNRLNPAPYLGLEG